MASHSEVWLKGNAQKNRSYTAQQVSIRCTVFDVKKAAERGEKAQLSITRKSDGDYHLLRLTPQDVDDMVTSIGLVASEEARTRFTINHLISLSDADLLATLTNVLKKRKDNES